MCGWAYVYGLRLTPGMGSALGTLCKSGCVHHRNSLNTELREVLEALQASHWGEDGCRTLLIGTTSAAVLKVLTDTVRWRSGSRKEFQCQSLRETIEHNIKRWEEHVCRVQIWKLPKDVTTLAEDEARAAAVNEFEGLEAV